jgi:hypothetical protein
LTSPAYILPPQSFICVIEFYSSIYLSGLFRISVSHTTMPSLAGAPATKRPTPVARKAVSVPGGPTKRHLGKTTTATAAAAKKTPAIPSAGSGASPLEIMAARLANRVGEIAENITFIEKPQ